MKWIPIICRAIILYYSAPASISVKVASGRTMATGRTTKWSDENLSGYFHLVEFFEERPVYKVILSTKSSILRL